jgi:hypothetical protein
MRESNSYIKRLNELSFSDLCMAEHDEAYPAIRHAIGSMKIAIANKFSHSGQHYFRQNAVKFRRNTVVRRIGQTGI